MTYTVTAGTAMAQHVNALIDAKMSVPAVTSSAPDSGKLDQIIGLLQQNNYPAQQGVTTSNSLTAVTTGTEIHSNIHQQWGMCAKTGKILTGIEHIKQSVDDILLTLLKSRVMRRLYGSNIPDLIDDAMSKTNMMLIYSATAEALANWEPRIHLTSVKLGSSNPIGGRLEMTLRWKISKDYRWLLPQSAQNDSLYDQTVRLAA